jgi:cobalt-zinc-cadmium efflux system protein
VTKREDRAGAALEPHRHGVGADTDRRALWIAAALIGGFLAFEVVAAFASGSLALLADAGHMLTDAGAIGAALWANGLSRRPATPRWTFGMQRAEIIAAGANGLTLAIVAAVLLVEAVRRLVSPPPVHGAALIVVAAVGVAVNLVVVMVLRRANRRSLNMEGAFQHVLTDLAAFVGTIVAGVVIVTTGFRRADPIATLVVVVLMARAAWKLLGASGRVLMEATPDEMDLAEVRRHILELDEVVAVHDLHAWTLTSELPVISAHVVVEESCLSGGAAPLLLRHLQDCLAGHFDVEHSTFQLEPAVHAGDERSRHD